MTWRAKQTAAGAGAPARRAAPSPTAESLATRRPLELLWPAAPAAVPGPGASQDLGGVGAAAPSSTSAPARTAAVAATRSPAGSDGVVRATALDPALANRLAEEVMRRIDHRARIERERRGH